MSCDEGKPARSIDPEDIFQSVLNRSMSRRRVLGTSSVLSAAACLPAAVHARRQASSLTFAELAQGLDEDFTVAEGYQHQVLLRWGDPLFPGAPDFDPYAQTFSRQMLQFGFNNDFIGYLPMPHPLGKIKALNRGRLRQGSRHGLLVVNHEYTSPRTMFPGSPAASALNRDLTDVDIAAHGLSVVEIRRKGEAWEVQKNYVFNRRITPYTPMRMTGPAAGSDRLKTPLSPNGVQTFGTYGNCAGGLTPWGTILTGEENVDMFFTGDYSNSGEQENYERFGFRGSKSWGRHYDRWNLEKNPREGLHMGWIVEIDPYNPLSVPRKLTALGRCKHEGANIHLNADGRVVAYTGDDAPFEYIYKFVSKHGFQPGRREANKRLLEEGTLYAARFNDDGTLDWLPLVYGQGPLRPDNGFFDQGDVVLDLRKAGDLVGATPMDRPEDIEVNPYNGRVYAMLSNNSRRTPAQVDAVNPRPANGNGQIVEFWPADLDHAADTFVWDMFLLAGNPRQDDTLYHPAITADGWLSCPDNCAFDSLGNLWIATDGAERSGIADGVWATEVSGPNRALTRRFIRAPLGAELAGPFFTPDDESFFCSVQHPGQRGTFEEPHTRWPTFDPAIPALPAVVVVTREGGGRIGS